MNLTLRSVYQTAADGNRFWKCKEVYVRGSTIKYVRIPEELLDSVKEEQAKQRRGPGGGGRGGGRGGELFHY